MSIILFALIFIVAFGFFVITWHNIAHAAKRARMRRELRGNYKYFVDEEAE